MRKKGIFYLRLVWFFLMFLLNVPVIFAQEKTIRINFEVLPLLQNDEAKLKVTLSFKGNKSGVTTVKLPDGFAGQEQLYRSVKNLKIITPNAKLDETEKPELKKINHLPNATVTIEYELIQDWQGNPNAGNASTDEGGGYRPVIKKEYFHVLGNGFWIIPNLPEEAKLKIAIAWKDFPKDWNLANSFGANQTKQNFQTDVGALMSSVFIGGDFQIDQRSIKGKPIWTAIRGKWKFTNQDFANLIEKIIGIEREFWNDYKHPYFLVTLIPLESEPNSRSAGGTGLTDSFATFVTTNMELNDLPFLFAHEYFHNWNSRGFGGMKQPEALTYWFSEGFTDYFTYLLLLRSGLIDVEKYLAKYNQFLREYYLSAVRNESNQRVLADFFRDNEVSKLPYRRGLLLATKWNQIIRQQSKSKKSLDDVMRNILLDARTKKIKELSKDYLISIFSKYANYDFAADVEKYIEKGETVGGFSGVFGDCIQLEEIRLGTFELGISLESLKDKVISGVVKNSAADEAGLRDGQKILERKAINLNDPTKKVEMIVEAAGEKKSISFFPQTQEKIVIPQFKLNGNETCLKNL